MIRDSKVGSSSLTAPRRGRGALRTLNLALAGLLGVGLTGCTDWAGYDLDHLWGYAPFLSTMRGSVTYDPYELPRVPAEGTIPVVHPQGDVPPLFAQAQLDSAAATLTNPFAGSAPPEVLTLGSAVYGRQCAVCHGPTGAGNGPVVGQGKYPFAPPLNGPQTAGRSDGYLYGVIAVGRGLMPPYGERMTHVERWAVVSYLRSMQAQAGAPPAAVSPTSPSEPSPPVATPAGSEAGAAAGTQP